MGSETTTKLTIRLPRRDIEFAKAYAKAHGMSVTEVIDRYPRRMRALEEHTPSPELGAITSHPSKVSEALLKPNYGKDGAP